MAYYVLVGETESGPFEAAEIRQQFVTGEITAETFIWQEGMTEWSPVLQVDEFADLAGEVETIPAPEPNAGESTVAQESSGERTEAPRAEPQAPSEASGGGVMENLRKGAEIAKKQTALKKLELTDLRAAYHEVGQLAVASDEGAQAFAGELQQLQDLNEANDALQQAEPENPDASLAEKAKRTAVAAKKRAELEANKIKQKQITGDIGKRVVLEGIVIAGTENAVAKAAGINAQIESLQNEINQIGAGASAWARHPMLVIAGLVILLGGGFFFFRGGNKPPSFAERAEAANAEIEAQWKEEREQREKASAEQKSRIEARQEAGRIKEANDAKQREQEKQQRAASRKARDEARKVAAAKEQATKSAAIAQRAQGRVVSGDPKFVATDFSNLHALARQFGASSKPTSASSVTTHLMMEMSDPGFQRIFTARKAMLAGRGGHATAATVFTAEFNELIKGKLLYDENLFRSVNLSTLTRELLEEIQAGHNAKYKVHLNRLLLEDAFAGEIKPRLQQTTGFAIARSGASPAFLNGLRSKERAEEAAYQLKQRQTLAMSDATVAALRLKLTKFVETDGNKDAVVDLPEFKAFWQKLDSNRSYKHKNKATQIFRIADTDGNARLSRMEWLNRVSDSGLYFLDHDANGDFRLAPSEFQPHGAAKATTKQPTKKGLKTIHRATFADWDPDGDGFISPVEWIYKGKGAAAEFSAESPKWEESVAAIKKIELANFTRLDADGNKAINLAEFTKEFGDRANWRVLKTTLPPTYKRRTGIEASRGDWEDFYSKSKKRPLLSWHEVWFAKIDQDGDNQIYLEEWLGHKNLAKVDREFVEADFAEVMAYMPAEKIVYPKFKATLLFALSKGLVTARLSSERGKLHLLVKKTELLKGIDVYLSLQEGALLLPKDREYPRFAVREFGGGDHRVLTMLARRDAERESHQWGLRVIQLDLGKGAPTKPVDFELQTSGMNELAALMFGNFRNARFLRLLGMSYYHQDLTKEDIEVHGKSFSKEFEIHGCSVYRQPYFETSVKAARDEVRKFRADKSVYLKKETARIQALMKAGQENRNWNYFSPIIPPKVAAALR